MKWFGANLSVRRLCIILIGIFLTVGILGGFYLFAKREALLRDALDTVEQEASKFIGTRVKIGNAFIDEFNLSSLKDSALVVDNIEVFDNHSELITKVDRARITFKLLNFYDRGAGAIDEIDITGAQAFLRKRTDDSWNVQDIKIEDSGESTFDAQINLSGGVVTAEFDGKSITVDELEVTADCADMSAIETEISAATLGSHIKASGTVGADKQYINANVDTADFMKILPYIPAELIPENIEIHSGVATDTAINILRRGDVLSYSGYTKFFNGAVRIEETEIKNISGSTFFTDAKYDLDASAEANGQFAKLRGYIRTDTDEPYFDINVESEDFTPAAIIENIGVEGAAAFTAHIFGTANDPKVEAQVTSNYLGYENLSARNVKSNFRYANDAVYLSNIYAETFGGAVTGEFELDADNLAYNSHLKVNGINLAQVRNYVGNDLAIFGAVDADLALNGVGADFSTLNVYGAANGSNIYYGNFLVNNLESSFHLKAGDVNFDYLNLKLPNHGTINLEGTLVDAKKLDLSFYGAHVDLSLVRSLDSAIAISGMSDFSGSIHGDLDNPQIALTLSAIDTSEHGGVKGELFKQKFDSMNVEMSGSLDAVNVASFELEKDGNKQWQVIDGRVNLKERQLNVRLDTVGARLEGIVALFAPDQNLTGEIDNTIRVQGSFENPELVGYVEMHYGSYNGILITGMRGDYYIENGDKFRLQDFEIVTPMVDMVLNGTLNIKNSALDMVVNGREIDLRRFRNQFPYDVSGTGKFEGVIGGNISAPKFDGQFTSESLIFNGVELKNISGHIGATGNSVVLDDAKFEQGRGKYAMFLTADLASKAMTGSATVEHVDIESLAALANYKTKFLSGELTSKIDISGTVNNPSVRVLGEIPKGAIGAYDLHELEMDLNYSNNVARVNRFSGKQGDKGEFEVAGSADLNGPLNLTGVAKNIELGMLGAFLESDADFVGTTNFTAEISGDVNNPVGELAVEASGGIKGSTFDALKGHVTFKDWIFDVKELLVERAIGDKVYRAGAKGTIPYEALYIENTNPSAEMNLQISLDDADLSLLPVLSSGVSWATGEMAGNLSITGMAASPNINGTISLKDGTVKVKGMKSLIEHINIATEFTGDKFMIEDFSGNIGDGKFTIDGGLSYSNFSVSDYNFKFVADALDIKSDFFTGPLNAEFAVTEEILRTRTLPKISGHVDLEKCLFSVPAIPDSDDEPPEVLIDLAINFGDKVHFYSSRLYNMYLTGGVRYEGSLRQPKPSGIISVKRGATMNYLSTVFDVSEGELHFNQMGSFLPSLNFNANARVSDIRVALSVTGPLSNAQVKLTSNPEKTETEIMQILTLRDAYGNQTSNMSMADVLAIGLQMSILGDIEDTIKRTLGFDRFAFSSGSGSALDTFASKEDPTQREEEFNISVGKYVTNKLMLKYTQGINGDKITRYGFQYDLNDNLGLTLEREKSEYIFSLEARYKF